MTDTTTTATITYADGRTEQVEMTVREFDLTIDGDEGLDGHVLTVTTTHYVLPVDKVLRNGDSLTWRW